jgi:hypothetical protein
MDEENIELIERRLIDRVREAVEKELKRRYWWLGIITLVLTSGTVTLIVNAILADARLKLETARAVQELSTDRINKASDKVAELTDKTTKIQGEFEKRAQEAEARFTGLSDKAKSLSEEVSNSSKRSLSVASQIQGQLARLSGVVQEIAEKPTAQASAGGPVVETLDDIQKVLKSSESKISEAKTSSDEFLKNFQNIMLGKWAIDIWRDDSGYSHSGILSVDQRLGEEKFRGTFHIVSGIDGRKINEDVTITRDGATVHLIGHVVNDVRWQDDTMNFELKDNFLVGSVVDKAGRKANVVLRKLL